MNLLFDLDGTLTNPALGITGCILHALERLEFGALPRREELHWCIGPPLRDSFAQLLETEDERLIEEAVALYRERFADVGLFENEVYHDIPDGLSSLREAGHQMWVATSKPHVYARKIVEHFGLLDFFQGVYGSELSGENVHKSDLIALILEQEGLPGEQVWMIGDRAQDIVGAQANELRTIGVLWGFGDQAELEGVRSEFIVDSMASLIGVVSAAARSD